MLFFQTLQPAEQPDHMRHRVAGRSARTGNQSIEPAAQRRFRIAGQAQRVGRVKQRRPIDGQAGQLAMQPEQGASPLPGTAERLLQRARQLDTRHPLQLGGR